MSREDLVLGVVEMQRFIIGQLLLSWYTYGERLHQGLGSSRVVIW